jgi:plastocyanin
VRGAVRHAARQEFPTGAALPRRDPRSCLLYNDGPRHGNRWRGGRLAPIESKREDFMPKPRLILALALSPLVLAAACGEGSTTETPVNGTNGNGSTQAPLSASVSMVSTGDGYGDYTHTFNPSSVTVRSGGTVTWANNSGQIHNVTFSGSSGAPSNIGNHDSGSNGRTFQETGSFSYSCTNHAGMHGTVTVVSD